MFCHFFFKERKEKFRHNWCYGSTFLRGYAPQWLCWFLWNRWMLSLKTPSSWSYHIDTLSDGFCFIWHVNLYEDLFLLKMRRTYNIISVCMHHTAFIFFVGKKNKTLLCKQKKVVGTDEKCCSRGDIVWLCAVTNCTFGTWVMNASKSADIRRMERTGRY